MRKFTAFLLALFFLTQSALPIRAAEASAISLQRIIGVLDSQAKDLRQGLVNLSNLNDGQKQSRQAYLIFLDGVLSYYEALQVNDDGSNVKAIATEIRSRRQNNYQTEIRKISDFVLVYQARHIVETAENRFARINSDLDRLISLDILKNKPDQLLIDAHASLVSARGLITQAENNLGGHSSSETLRFLVSGAVGNIRQAYKDFFAISSYVATKTSK